MLQRVYTVSESFILVPQLDDHVAQHFDFFARRDVHVADQALRLAANGGLDLATDPLRRSRGVGDEAGDVVEQAFGRHGTGLRSGSLLHERGRRAAQWRRHRPVAGLTHRRGRRTGARLP